jgi:putative hemolysin
MTDQWTEKAKNAAREDGKLLPPPSNPMAVARVLLTDHSKDGKTTLLFWGGGWMQWKRRYEDRGRFFGCGSTSCWRTKTRCTVRHAGGCSPSPSSR